MLVQPVGRDQILIAKVDRRACSIRRTLLITGIAICLAVGGREISSARMAIGFVIPAILGIILFAWQLLVDCDAEARERISWSADHSGGWALHGVAVPEWGPHNRSDSGRGPLALCRLRSELGKSTRGLTCRALQSLILAGHGVRSLVTLSPSSGGQIMTSRVPYLWKELRPGTDGWPWRRWEYSWESACSRDHRAHIIEESPV